MFDENKFQALVAEAVKQALKQQGAQEYYGYADVKQFIEISGISKRDMEDRVIPHPEFKHCVSRFDGGHKRYIHIRKGLDALDKILIKEAVK